MTCPLLIALLAFVLGAQSALPQSVQPQSAPTPVPAQVAPQKLIGEIDFFGTEGIDVQKARAAIPVHEGDELTDDVQDRVSHAVEQALGHAPTDIAVGCCDEHGSNSIYIGLGGSNTVKTSWLAAPTAATCLPQEAKAFYDQDMDALGEAVRSGRGAEDDSKGYALQADPTMRAVQMAMRDYALSHEPAIEHALAECASPEHRRAAATLLGYAQQSERQIAALIHASRDRDETVRNNAVRALLVLANADSPAKLATQIPAADFIPMLNSGTWTDRNKAGQLLSALTRSRDRRLLEQLRLQAMPSLIEMARWRNWGHADAYRAMLGRIAGLPEAGHCGPEGALIRFFLFTKESPRGARVAISIAMIALGDGAKIPVADLQRDLKTNWPDLPDAENTDEKEDTVAFRIGRADVIYAHMPVPIPWADLKGPCATSILWPDAARALEKHKSHLIVTVSDERMPMARAKLLTQVVAAIAGVCPAAIGVYWGSSTLVIPCKLFRTFAIKILPQGPPIQMWIDFRVGRNAQGKSSGFTHGLAALGLMELETENASELPAKLRERLTGLATYLLENGLVIRDGDTVGADANERIRVVYSRSAFGHRDAVMRLEYEHE
jgi:hypothetical protein